MRDVERHAVQRGAGIECLDDVANRDRGSPPLRNSLHRVLFPRLGPSPEGCPSGPTKPSRSMTSACREGVGIAPFEERLERQSDEGQEREERSNREGGGYVVFFV